MDAWQRLVEDEREELHFFLQEEFTEMNKATVVRLQEEAGAAYDRVPQSEAAQWAYVLMAAEQALQQARIAEAMESIAAILDGWNASSVPIENVSGH